MVAVAKRISMKDALRSYTGIGDVLFLLVLCSVFSPFMYLIYWGFSTILAVLGYFVYNSIAKKPRITSPYVGVMALMLIAFILVRQFNPGFDFYDDELVANILRFG